MRQWRLLCIWACAVSVLSACQDNRETADTKPQHAAAPACEYDIDHVLNLFLLPPT